ncbi:MAG: Glutamate mutase sigma subunit [bacterium]|nr:Glutamate mutase sigma subunit [bacterium]
MNLPPLLSLFSEALFDTDRDRALQLVRDAIHQGAAAEELIFEVVIPALEKCVTDLEECEELNLAQHFLTSQIAADVTEELLPRFRVAPETVGRVVIGSPHGDLHTLGKRIVVGCLRPRMIECADLGVNVSAERFVEEAENRRASVIAISAMMVHTARSEKGCLKVRDILRERGLEDRIKVIIGGAPFRFDDQLHQRVGADGWAPDGIQAVKAISRLIREARPW